MEEHLLSRPPAISPLAAKLLTARRTLDILETVTENPRPVREIAEQVGGEVGKVWHHVRRLVAAGILKEAGSRARAGRPQKLYQASAEEFFVPAEQRKSTVSRELSDLLDASLDIHDSASGERFFHDGKRWRVEKAYSDDIPSQAQQHEFWLIARLDAQQRARLRDEVRELFERYSDEQSHGAKRTIVRFACAALPPETT